MPVRLSPLQPLDEMHEALFTIAFNTTYLGFDCVVHQALPLVR